MNAEERASAGGDLALWSAPRLVDALTAKEISGRELLDLHVERLDGLNPSLNAVATLDVEQARTAAERADEAMARERCGPLYGLPITVKDAIETAGARSTGGAPELEDHGP